MLFFRLILLSCILTVCARLDAKEPSHQAIGNVFEKLKKRFTLKKPDFFEAALRCRKALAEAGALEGDGLQWSVGSEGAFVEAILQGKTQVLILHTKQGAFLAVPNEDVAFSLKGDESLENLKPYTLGEEEVNYQDPNSGLLFSAQRVVFKPATQPTSRVIDFVPAVGDPKALMKGYLKNHAGSPYLKELAGLAKSLKQGDKNPGGMTRFQAASFLRQNEEIVSKLMKKIKSCNAKVLWEENEQNPFKALADDISFFSSI